MESPSGLSPLLVSTPQQLVLVRPDRGGVVQRDLLCDFLDELGNDPPTVPPTSSEYTKAGLPWFDYYSDSKAVEGSEKLATVKSVAQLGKEKGDVPLPENQSVNVENVIKLRKGLKEGQVREGRF